MPSPLRDAGPSARRAGTGPLVPPRRGLLRRRARLGPFASGRLDFGPGPLRMHESRPDGPAIFRPPKKRVEAGTVFAAAVALATVGVVASLVYRGTRVTVEAKGISDGAQLTTVAAAGLQVELTFESDDDASGATFAVDGAPVEEPAVTRRTLVWRPPAPLAEGRHEVTVAVPRMAFGDSVHRWRFTVDGKAPRLTVPPVVDAVPLGEPVEVEGRVEPGARLTADGDRVPVDGDGAFALSFRRPPAGPVTLEATDRAGNAAMASVVVPVTYPGFRGVHVTAAAWTDPGLRAGVLALLDQRRIDTVELDLKDDTGLVLYDSEVPRAREVGAVAGLYDLDAAVAAVTSHGGRVVGRISAFRDPLLAGAAWAAGQGDQVVQAPGGRPWDDGGGPWTNPAHAAVRRYNLDLAIEAVNRGVDDVLWDDARLPTASPGAVVAPGVASPSDAVAAFLAAGHDELRRRGAYQGVVTVGEAPDKGDAVGQDLGRVARNADYVAAEVVPGYWGPGRHGVGDPRAQPAPFTAALLARFQKAVAGTGTVLVPVLQDFPAGGLDPDDATVRAMVDAARSVSVDRFLLWSQRVRYSAALLDAPATGR